VKIVASDGARAFVTSHGGRLWVWLDPHRFMSTSYVWLVTATEVPGSSRATRRMRSARRPHQFRSFEAEGIEVLLDSGRLPPPDELHLELKGWPRKRVRAYWNGFEFVGEDVPPPGPDMG
jgi:hypothetical protein